MPIKKTSKGHSLTPIMEPGKYYITWTLYIGEEHKKPVRKCDSLKEQGDYAISYFMIRDEVGQYAWQHPKWQSNSEQILYRAKRVSRLRYELSITYEKLASFILEKIEALKNKGRAKQTN